MADYFKKKHLVEFGEGKFGEDAPEYWKNFMNYYGNVMAEGELTTRDQDQIAEAIHVAAAMKAGITLVHGLQSKELSDKLSN